MHEASLSPAQRLSGRVAPPPARRRWLARLAVALVLGGLLALATAVYLIGEVLLGGTLLLLTALAAWVYSSPRAVAYRYLFPGIAAALVFVVFPMLYTIGISFTNHSSKNLLSAEQAERYFLDETYRAGGSTLAFTVHADGSAYRLRLVDPDGLQVHVSPPLDLAVTAAADVLLQTTDAAGASALGEPVGLRDLIALQPALKALTLVLPASAGGQRVRLSGLREFAPVRPLWQRQPDGSLLNQQDGRMLTPNAGTGFYEGADGKPVAPGFRVGVGLDNYLRIVTEARFREPFLRILAWTVSFAALTVLGATALGLLLAVLLSWPALRFKSVYKTLLFLPYAVPGFISILVFRGLFNQNTGEINLLLDALFGIRPAWFSDPLLAKLMLLIVNVWLGFPYMMLVCMGLIRSIPGDLAEASAVAGVGPLAHFRAVTLPLILKPLTPLLIASFAYNFNNFVLVSLLTRGLPDFLDTSVPAGTTDILVSYTYRIAFKDSGQQFGLAAAVSTVIFLIVAAITLLQMRLARVDDGGKR